MKYLISIFISLFFILSTTFSATTGLDCWSAHVLTLDIESNYQFAEEQNELYFEFTAINDSMLIDIDTNSLTPYPNIIEVQVYEKVVDCDVLNLIYTTNPNEFAEDDYLLLNLVPTRNYLIKLKRDPNQVVASFFKKKIKNHKMYHCPVFSNQCGKKVLNGDFETVKQPISNYLNAFAMGEICQWHQLSWSPPIILNSMNNHAQIYSVGSASSTGVADAFMQNVSFLNNTDYSISLDLWYDLNYPAFETAPTSVRVFLVKNSVLQAIPGVISYADLINITNNQEIVNIPGSSLTTTPQNFSFCFHTNDSYDVIYFLADPNSTASVDKNSNTNFDNIDVREFSTANAGPDIVLAPCGLPQQIGPGEDCTIKGATYSWSPSTGLSDASVANPYASPSTNTIYTLTVTLGNCTMTDDVLVYGNPSTSIDFVFPDGKDIAWGAMQSADISYITTLGANYSSDKSFYINGELTVDENWILDSCQIWMGENAKIKVTNGVTFDFNGNSNSFITSCGERWDGIYADGNCSIEIEETHPFRYSDNGLVSTDGADIIIDYVDFEQNERCITSTSALAPIAQTLRIKNSSFICDPPLQYSNGDYYYPNKVIDLQNLFTTLHTPTSPRYLQIRNNNFDATAGFIHADQADVEIKDNTFDNFNFTPGQPNYPGDPAKSNIAVSGVGRTNAIDSKMHFNVSGNIFLRTRIAIRTYDNMDVTLQGNFMNKTGPNGTIEPHVSGNTFYQSYDNYIPNNHSEKGIYQIKHNELRNVNYGFLIYDTEASFNIRNNEIYNDYFVDGKGFLIDANNLIERPTIVFNDNKIKFAHKAIEFLHVFSNPERFLRNEIEEVHAYTPNCGLPSCDEIPGFGLRVYNSLFDVGKENKFINSQYTNNTNVEGIIIDNSVYTVYCNKIEYFGSGVRFNGWCSNQNRPNLSLSENHLKNCHWGVVLSNYAAIGTLGASNDATSNDWDVTVSPYTGSDIRCINGTNGLGSQLYYLSSVSSPSPNTSDASSTPLSITSGTGNGLGCSAPARLKSPKQKSNNIHWLKSKQRRINAISDPNRKMYESQMTYLALLGDSSINNDSTLITYKDSLSRLPFGILLDKKKRGLNHSFISNVNANHSFDIDVRFVLSMDIKRKNGQSIDKSQILKLRNLASACPYSKGFAVYQARNLLGKLGEYNFWNKCEFIDTSFTNNQSKRRIKSLNEMVKIFPNPTQNELTIAVEVENDDQVELCLYNLIGSKVACYNIGTGSQRTISLQQLNNGLYVYRLIYNGEIIHRGKQLIQR